MPSSTSLLSPPPISKRTVFPCTFPRRRPIKNTTTSPSRTRRRTGETSSRNTPACAAALEGYRLLNPPCRHRRELGRERSTRPAPEDVVAAAESVFAAASFGGAFPIQLDREHRHGNNAILPPPSLEPAMFPIRWPPMKTLTAALLLSASTLAAQTTTNPL